jgi:hypothetical protein
MYVSVFICKCVCVCVCGHTRENCTRVRVFMYLCMHVLHILEILHSELENPWITLNHIRS